MSVVNPILRQETGEHDLPRLIPDLVEGLPHELVTSRGHLSALVLEALGPLSDGEERAVLREITRRPWFDSLPSRDGHRFRLDGRWPDLVEFGGRLWDLEGGPMPLGSRRAWGHRDRRAVLALLGPRLDPGVVGTREQRAELLIEHGLLPGLFKLGVEAQRTPRGVSGPRSSSDLVATLRRGGRVVLVNIEGRNRRWEILDRLTDRDKRIFGEAARRLIPTVVVAPRVTKRYREQLARFTNGLCEVVETGVCIVPSRQVIKNLGDWAPWPMVLRLPDEVLELVAAELEAAADRYLAADLGPQVPDLAMFRTEDQELLRRIRTYRDSHWRCSREEAAAALGVSVPRLRRAWALASERWDSWSTLLG